MVEWKVEGTEDSMIWRTSSVGSEEKDIVEGGRRGRRGRESKEGRMYLIYRDSVCISSESVETVNEKLR